MRDQAKCVKEMRLSENKDMVDKEESEDVGRNELIREDIPHK